MLPVQARLNRTMLHLSLAHFRCCAASVLRGAVMRWPAALSV